MTEKPHFATSVPQALREPIPRAVVLATWANAWLANDCSADDVTAALSPFGAQRIASSLSGPEPDGPSDIGTDEHSVSGLIVGLAELGVTRSSNVSRLRVVLPAIGDPTGLPGPARFNQQAIEAGQAIVVDHLSIGLIPQTAGTTTHWVAHQTTPGFIPGVAIRPEEAARQVRLALIEATSQLASLDLAAGRDDVSEAVTRMQAQLKQAHFPASLAGSDQHTIFSAAQILGICKIALAFARPTPTASLDQQRTRVLTDLATTARRCLAAAANPR
ncbi:MAG: hypothetical protein WC054_02895 [Candidatus Nanopelagicales bacterium]